MSKKHLNRLEGNAATRILKMMKEESPEVDINFHVAMVKSVDPFSIRLTGDSYDIPDKLIYVNQLILPHERKMDIEGTADFSGAATFNGESGTVNVAKGAFNGVDMVVTFKEGYIKSGDEVFVIEANDGQRYYVIDKVVG